ncbi:hypothetical protein [Leuconostoc lactis]|uniref:hypothetical protein n=1 Tax=Leuconostoc lactis TaxID=1246 RepID=UPI00049797CE|nr:hypothetical protein [Leuconostoc lactis]
MSVLLLILNPILGLIYTIGTFSKSIVRFRGIKILIIGVVFFFLGYSIQLKNQNADLARYLSWLPNYEFSRVLDILHDSFFNKNVFVIQPLMLSFFSKFSNPSIFIGFIPFVFYTSYAYIYVSLFNGSKFSGFFSNKKVIAFYFGLAIISFGWVVTSVRNPMANALISVALFRDLYLNKKGILTGLFYLIAVSMHVGVMPILVCRIFFGAFFSKRFYQKLVSFIFGIILIIVAGTTNVLSEFTNKADTYGVGSNGGGFSTYARTSVYYVVNNTFILWLMILSFAALVLIKRQTRENNYFYNFLKILVLIAIMSFFMPTPLIDRYGMIVEIFLPMMLMEINFSKLTQRQKFLSTTALFFSGVFGLLWQIAYLAVQIDVPQFIFRCAIGWIGLFINH